MLQKGGVGGGGGVAGWVGRVGCVGVPGGVGDGEVGGGSATDEAAVAAEGGRWGRLAFGCV